ncbi:transposase [Janthinobacterium sp. NKUCC06_STL]|uniref:IS66 family transposase n=1 Tax=Janthinobacterium sp. NKUCC06_STL TaxID=2842127 RepID=UPI001C5B2859|nr:transposase [Janthinobacterium sp. NKUCC06_STL]
MAKPPDERKAVGQKCYRPLLVNLEWWLGTAFDQLSRKSVTAAAIKFSLNLWPVLLRYCCVGAIKIDNSAVELVLRGVAIGCGNYLFAGTDRGGERAAAIYRISAGYVVGHRTC